MKDRKLLNSELGRISEYGSGEASGLVIVLDNVRSAHNVGSAFRTGDAFHVDKMVLCGICATPGSAELHKTALGAEMCVPWEHYDNTLDAVSALRAQGYRIACVEQTENSVSLQDFDLRSLVPEGESACCAFVFGNEVAGVDQAVVDASDFSLEIPQFGTKHSLNVSVSVGIVLWQAVGNILKKSAGSALAALVLLFTCMGCECTRESADAAAQAQSIEEQQEEIFPYGFNPALYEAVDAKVKSGETFPGLFVRMGLSQQRAQELTNLCHTSGAFDMRRLRADNPITAYYSPDTLSRSLEYLVYRDDRIHSTVFSLGDSLMVSHVERPTRHERRFADVSINTSLWNDMLAAGISPLLIVELADIYAWTINFFGLQKGDRFRAIYTQTVCCDDGEVVQVDSVLFSIYNSGDFQSIAVRFDQNDGRNKYWNEKGESMRKAFLKAPLKFNRISSGFTYHRKHPVTGKVRAHTAVDYAAPKGTHVHSIGDGTVTLCGWDPNGGGNRIKIRHMNGYETSYMHLSGFAKGIKAGSRVAQGQLIGYVGSTGTSTGPHLDFRVWKDKTPINPLKMIAPPSEPLKAENLDSLKSIVAKYMEEMK